MKKKDQWILSVKEYEKFIDMISESTFQPLRNYYLMTFDFVSLMKSIQSYLKRLLKYSSLFQLHTCVKSIFLHIVKPTYCNRLNTEADMTSIKPGIRDLTKYKTMAFSLIIFCLVKRSYFSLKTHYV